VEEEEHETFETEKTMSELEIPMLKLETTTTTIDCRRSSCERTALQQTTVEVLDVETATGAESGVREESNHHRQRKDAQDSREL